VRSEVEIGAMTSRARLFTRPPERIAAGAAASTMRELAIGTVAEEPADGLRRLIRECASAAELSSEGTNSRLCLKKGSEVVQIRLFKRNPPRDANVVRTSDSARECARVTAVCNPGTEIRHSQALS
jgi:hypothetical protein